MGKPNINIGKDVKTSNRVDVHQKTDSGKNMNVSSHWSDDDIPSFIIAVGPNDRISFLTSDDMLLMITLMKEAITQVEWVVACSLEEGVLDKGS